MAIEVVSSDEDENRKLAILENRRDILYERIENDRQTIYQLGQEYGDVALQGGDAALQGGAVAMQRLYGIQQFRGTQTLDPTLTGVSPYAMDILCAMADRARRWLPHVTLRGV